MPAEEEGEEGEEGEYYVQITINMAENKNMLTPGDKVFFRTDTGMEEPMKVVKVRRMLGTNFLAATAVKAMFLKPSFPARANSPAFWAISLSTTPGATLLALARAIACSCKFSANS